MKNKLFFILLFVIGIISLILGVTINPNEQTLYYMVIPFTRLGLGLRSLLLSGSGFQVFLGYLFYILIGLLPLIYPIVRYFIKKEWNYTSFLWLIVSGFLFFFMYYLINPQLITNIIEFSDNNAKTLALIGLEFTLLGLVSIVLILDFVERIKKNPLSAISVCNFVLYLVLVLILFAKLFLGVIKLRNSINCVKGIDEAFVQEKFNVSISVGFNITHIIFMYLIDVIPYIFIVVLIKYVLEFVNTFKNDIYDKNNADKLKLIKKLTVFNVLVFIGVEALHNFITFIVQNKLINANYHLNIDVSYIIITLICSLFCVLLDKSIEIKEENELTI